MKQIMIAAILVFGVVAQPSVVSHDQGSLMDDGKAIGAPTIGSQGDARQLTTDEAEMLVGGDTSGCWSFYDENGDEHGICCVDLWIVTICIGVNVSAFERLLPFL